MFGRHSAIVILHSTPDNRLLCRLSEGQSSAMTTAVAMQPAMPRPTSIPIAPARTKAKQPMSGKENFISTKSVAPQSAVANIRTRRERPCDACRRRKSRCVIHEGAVLCVLCEFHKQDCTFVQSPLPRKRKPSGDAQKDETPKKK